MAGLGRSKVQFRSILKTGDAGGLGVDIHFPTKGEHPPRARPYFKPSPRPTDPAWQRYTRTTSGVAQPSHSVGTCWPVPRLLPLVHRAS